MVLKFLSNSCVFVLKIPMKMGSCNLENVGQESAQKVAQILEIVLLRNRGLFRIKEGGVD